MSVLTLKVDEVMRTLSAESSNPFVVHDKEVDIVRFAINSGFADIVLDGQVALRVMYQRPGETEVRAQTLTYYDTDGLHNYYDWQLSQPDLAKDGSLMVALCILRTDSELEEWHTTPCQVRVLDTIHTDDSDEADETITPTVAQRVAVLESVIQGMAGGAPVVVDSASDMTDTDQIYVLSTDGNWYYHNGSTWVAGGVYGGVPTDAQVESIFSDWLDDHPEATTTVQDGSLSAIKFTEDVIEQLSKAGTKDKQDDSFRYNFDSVPSVITKRNIKEGSKYFSEDDNYVYLQGACYNTANKHIYIIVPKIDYSDCKIIEISMTSYTGAYTKIKESVFSNLGHGNDMTYNSKTNRLCVINNDKIIIIDPETLTTESEHTIEYSMASIDYDRDDNVYYCHVATTPLIVVDADNYTVISNYETSISDRLSFSSQMFVGQGGFLYKNYFVRIYVKTPTSDRAGYQIHYLVFIRKTDGEIDYVFPLWSENGGTEIETGWADGGNIILIAGGNAFTVFSIDSDTENIHEIRPSYYHGFAQLENNANLNNRLINGHWVTGGDAATQTILNKPSDATGAISLDIRQHGLSFVRQYLVDVKNEMYTRLWTNAIDGWTDWVKFLTDKNVTVETFNSYSLIDFKTLKTYCLIGRYAASALTWSGMKIAGKMTPQLSIELPSNYNVVSYASSLTCGQGGLFVTPEGISANNFRFRIVTLHNEPESHNVQVFIICKYS